jgi:hypothetical protein
MGARGESRNRAWCPAPAVVSCMPLLALVLPTSATAPDYVICCQGHMALAHLLFEVSLLLADLLWVLPAVRHPDATGDSC